jgi:hypothetical protein
MQSDLKIFRHNGTDEIGMQSQKMYTGSACRGSEQNMANSTLQSLFREPRTRLTDRTTFVQVISRLSSYKEKRAEEERKFVRQAEKAA